MKLHTFSIIILLSLAAVNVTGCREGGASESGSASSGSGILKKKIGELTEDDMKAAATALGWGDKPTSSHSKGANETIIVSGDKEDPSGTESPDGKKRVRMSIGLYIEKTPADAEKQKASLEKRGHAAVVEGNRVLSANFYNAKGDDKAKGQEILDKLLGK